MTIVEADLKCRGSPDVIDSHLDKPLSLDPITLEELGDLKHTFVTPSGTCIHYNLESFVNYVNATRDFSDPVTRYPLELEDLKRIDQRVEDAGLILPSLVELFQNKSEYFLSKNNHSNELRSMEACLGELINDMMKTIEKRRTHSDDLEYRLLIIFSEFESPFQDYKAKNLEAAYQSLTSWIIFLKGPPKKPTRDHSGALNQIIVYLKSQWSESDSEKLQALRGTGSGALSL